MRKKRKSAVEYLFMFKDTRMARISGEFMFGGFNISQKKLQAIFDNQRVLKAFSQGKYDEVVDELPKNSGYFFKKVRQ